MTVGVWVLFVNLYCDIDLFDVDIIEGRNMQMSSLLLCCEFPDQSQTQFLWVVNPTQVNYFGHITDSPVHFRYIFC